MWHPEHLTAEQLEQRRLDAVPLRCAGRRSQAEIAREIGVSPAAVSQWTQRLREATGTAGLKRRPPRIPGLVPVEPPLRVELARPEDLLVLSRTVVPGEILPRKSGAEDEENAGQALPVRDARSAILRLRWLDRQEWLDDGPQLLG